tara:strand:- start:14 stop:376 length:363 start_codon:yes stop_codon:yes gene_type:complete
VDDVEAGFYVKDDGRVNPVDATMALAKGAKMRGVKIHEGVTVEKALSRNGSVEGVVCSSSSSSSSSESHVIKTNKIVNCGGMWGRQLGYSLIHSLTHSFTHSFAHHDPTTPLLTHLLLHY